jgi:hydroxylamine reductase (hybrid-cluster protein)
VFKDCILITTTCGKFRINDIDYGTIPGTEIPRYIDLGQSPEFLSPGVVGVLQSTFGLNLISGDAKADLERMPAGK